LPRAAAPARIEAEAMSKDKEARRDATTAIRPGSTGTGMDESYAVGGRARRHPRPRPRAPQRSPAAGHDSALSANMSETVTPWKFSVEGEAGSESDERIGTSPRWGGDRGGGKGDAAAVYGGIQAEDCPRGRRL